MARWTDTITYPNLAELAPEDLFPVADMSEPEDTRQRHFTWGQVMAVSLVIVKHGANANYPRPIAGVAYWMGSIEPLNKQVGDMYLTTTAYD